MGKTKTKKTPVTVDSALRKLTKEEKKEANKIYLESLKASKTYLLLDFILMTFEVVCELAIPFISTYFFNALENLASASSIIRDQAMTNIYINLSIMAALAIFGLLSGIGCMGLATKAGNKFVFVLRNNFFKKVQQYSFKNLDHFEVSSLVTRITSDCNNIRLCIFMTGRVGMKGPLMLIVGSIFMFIMNWFLALMIVIIAAILSFILFFIIKSSVPLFTKTQKRVDNLNREVEENCDGIKEIKAFVREDHMAEKFAKTNNSLEEITVKVYSLMNINMPVVLLGLNFVTALILYYGGLNMINGTIFGMTFTDGTISAFINYSVLILMAFNFFSALVMQFVRAAASKHRIDEVMIEKIDIPYDVKEKKDGFDPNKIENGNVEFVNAGLSYSNNKRKLAVGPINLKVNKGEIIGVIGGTGAGKTSLISLIPRLYDTTIGECLIDGHNVKDYSVQALRDNIGVVTQKNVLFTGTIKENIKWGKKDATDEEIQEALSLAQAKEFVDNFLEKENTYVSQGGKSVSGGQKQRLSIARALIKKPKILILDDATSAVDTLTESKIKNCFYNELKDTTVFIIAQRISSVMDADKILVLDNGSVCGLGTHEELLTNCSIYKEIYDLQQSGVSE